MYILIVILKSLREVNIPNILMKILQKNDEIRRNKLNPLKFYFGRCNGRMAYVLSQKMLQVAIDFIATFCKEKLFSFLSKVEGTEEGWELNSLSFLAAGNGKNMGNVPTIHTPNLSHHKWRGRIDPN